MSLEGKIAAKARARRNPEALAKIAPLGGAASLAALTPEERKARAQAAVAAREADRAPRIARGESVDGRTPEQIAESTSAGGKARMVAMTAEERKAWAAKGNEKSNRVRELQQMAFGPIRRDRLVKLPRTSSRNSQFCFLKLIREIGEGPGGFGWTGVIMKPGSTVTQSQLRPDRRFPPQPVMLECAGLCGENGESVWILWKLLGGAWIEIGRCQSVRDEWSRALRPMAFSALNQVEVPAEHRHATLMKIFTWIRGWLDQRFHKLDAQMRMELLGLLHDDLCSRYAAALPNDDTGITVEAIEPEFSDA